jgi:hypothetical protein
MADLSLATLVAGKPVKLEKAGRTICVTRVGDEVFAIDDTCSHSDASLSEGEVFSVILEYFLCYCLLRFKKNRKIQLDTIIYLLYICYFT